MLKFEDILPFSQVEFVRGMLGSMSEIPIVAIENDNGTTSHSQSGQFDPYLLASVSRVTNYLTIIGDNDAKTLLEESAVNSSLIGSEMRYKLCNDDFMRQHKFEIVWRENRYACSPFNLSCC